MFRKGNIPWNKGRPEVQTPEQIKAFVERSVKYRTGRPLTEEHRKKIGLGNKGKRRGKTWEEIYGIDQVESIRKKITEHRSGVNHPFWGRKIPDEQKERQRQKLLGRFIGPKHPNWKGGVSWAYQYMVSRPEWLKIRKEIYERDQWRCQICHKHCERKEIQCHHIVPYKLSQDNNSDNLITLCVGCHKKEEEALLRQDTYLAPSDVGAGTFIGMSI